MVGQTKGPFYCGTAFCGHSTKKAARACWKRKCEALDAIESEVKALREAGKSEEAGTVQRKSDAYYPELNPANWPINRTSSNMQAEYIARTKTESSQ